MLDNIALPMSPPTVSAMTIAVAMAPAIIVVVSIVIRCILSPLRSYGYVRLAGAGSIGFEGTRRPMADISVQAAARAP